MRNNSEKKVIVAMSGGVDSSVSAALLKGGFYPELGRRVNVIGLFMKCWSEEEVKTGVCTAEEDERWARRAAAKIGIPFYSVDLVKEYKKKVVDYFVAEYKAGRTPNPDVMCNKEVKFGMFYDMAMKQFGADYVATGHYARLGIHSLHRSDLCNYTGLTCVKLLKGVDPGKDQSYFLWAVDSKKFRKVLFPIGEYKKTEVRKMARRFGLPNAERKDSQGICFIGKVDVGNFLHDYIENKKGAIVNARGERVGEHEGLHFYTIGQRRGVGVGGGPPYYVSQKDYKTNTLVVAREYDEELLSKNFTANDFNWIREKPRIPFRCNVKIRYRQEDQAAVLQKENNDGSIFIEFKDAQRAVTPGQSAVFYKGEELIGGGIII